MEIKWSKRALKQLTDALDFIVEAGFVSYAHELENKILSKVDSLQLSYNFYPIDRFKSDNDGTSHAVEVDEYRISYRIKNKQVKILRIRHTSRKPWKY